MQWLNTKAGYVLFKHVGYITANYEPITIQPNIFRVWEESISCLLGW